MHIVSGSGATDDRVSGGGTLTGLGNLIIGYDEDPGNLAAGDRGGSHNLILGRYNRFTTKSFAGVILGEDNVLNAEDAVIFGLQNTINGPGFSSILGGDQNTINQGTACIVGGYQNSNDANYSVVLGGIHNDSQGQVSVQLGGSYNTVTHDYSIGPLPNSPQWQN